VSAFSLSWLADHARGERRPDPANLPRRYWYSDKYDSIARFRQRDLVADPSLRAAWIEALIVDGLAIVDDMPDTDAGLEETAVLIGTIRPSFFGKFFEVKIHIQPTNLAFTAAALELHTDVPAEDMAPGIQFLHCRANSAAGGASLFADGATVAAELRAVAPSDFKLLAETSIPFYCEHEEFDLRARQRVIECDEHGEITGVTISQHVADVFDLPQAFLDAYYPAFCRFGKMLQSDKFLMRFRLNPGECIVFDNHRVVHGREPYAAASGERHLRGCYTDRGEMRSTYRVLKGRETCR
jgi:gamma-butyrobetaine dioxygenase